jgi:hypothetical protein
MTRTLSRSAAIADWLATSDATPLDQNYFSADSPLIVGALRAYPWFLHAEAHRDTLAGDEILLAHFSPARNGPPPS